MLLLLLGIVAGCAGSADDPGPKPPPPPPPPEAYGISPTLGRSLDDTQREILRLVDKKHIDESMKVLAARPHHAGSVHDLKSAEYVHQRFLSAGLESRIETYEVPIPRPIDVTVELLAPFAYRCALKEEPSDKDFDTHTTIALRPHLAFSADGDVTSRIVFVNRATSDDFARLKAMGIALDGAIGLARYGGLFRGTKVKNAATAGLAALLIYSDPADDGYMRGDPYPDGPWRPRSAVQRGSVLDIAQRPGDPLTPGIPAFGNAKRIPWEDVETLPSIPTTCLSAEDAEPILKSLGGGPGPDGWQGGLPFAYHLGGSKKVVARVRIQSDWSIRKIWNVIGHLRGSLHPDQWVVMGNHRDAWVHGAVDPCSGTAVMLESARVLGKLARSGQRSMRTIVFCSFDGEEYGLFGSVEYVEHFAKQIHERASMYINVDAAVSGPELGIVASPQLERLLVGTLRVVPDQRTDPPRKMLETVQRFEMSPPGGGSDFTAFLHRHCIPVIDLASSGPCGVYHSRFDTYGWMKHHGDPGFATHARMARLLAVLLHRAAGSTINPHDYVALARWLDVQTKALGVELADTGRPLDLKPLEDAISALSEAGAELNTAREARAKSDPDPAAVALLNRTIAGVNRTLVTDDLLPSRPFFRNPLVATDPSDGYGALVFPAIREALDHGDTKAATAALRDLSARIVSLGARVTGLASNLEP